MTDPPGSGDTHRSGSPGQAGHQLHGAGWDLRATGRLGAGPLPTGQFSVPAEQGVRLDEELGELGSGDQPADTGENRPVRRTQGWTRHLAREDRHHRRPPPLDFDEILGTHRANTEE